MSHVHCIGIGGIHVSAVAKLLKVRGVSVSGSDAYENEETKDLQSRGVTVAIGHDAKNVPEGTEIVVYTHAVPEENPELVEAKRRSIRCVDSHAYLAELFNNATQVVVTGTHGKSTTTAMLGLILTACGADPTVVVGTKCAGFPDGNLRVGRNDLLVVEGDEYHQHLLSYSSNVLVLNNIELDHVDVYPTIEAYEQVFAEAIGRMKPGDTVVVNADDERCEEVIRLFGYSVIRVGRQNGDFRIGKIVQKDGGSTAEIAAHDSTSRLSLSVPGEMNVRNAAMALAGALAVKSDLDLNTALTALAAFTGCWRRFERIGTYHGAVAISDYAHHPTEVAATLAAARAAYPEKRIILAFQPHHRNRTKNLFNEFVHCFDGADALLLVEIYDVPGRESAEDVAISSADLVKAIQGAGRGAPADRTGGQGAGDVCFVAALDNLQEALDDLHPSENNLIIFMGAGAIDAAGRKMVQS